jgi:Zn-dependent protease with chaperone function
MGRDLSSSAWLRAGEAAADAYAATLLPEPTRTQVAEALQRCSELLARLPVDPSAKLAPTRCQHATPQDQANFWRSIGFQAVLSTPAQLGEPGMMVEC